MCLKERLSVIIVILSVVLLIGPSFYNTSTPNHSPSLFENTGSSIAQSTFTVFSDEILLSTVDALYNHHVEPTLAISDNGTIFAGWKNSETHNGGGAQVSFTKSVDGGETWESPRDVTNFEGRITRKSDPWLVWHNDIIYYAYLEFTVSGDFSQITVAKSSDYGATWSEAAASHGSYFADKETMVVADNGTIFVAYDDIDTEESGLATVRLTRSVDGGNSFDEVSVIAEPSDGHVGPYLTLDNESNVFVCWTYLMEEGGNLFLDNSTDFGLTFGEERFVNSDGNYADFTTSVDGRPAKTTLPVIRFDSYNRLYCLWADTFDPVSRSFDVYLRFSDDFGFTWSDRILINSQTEGDQWMPDLDIDSEDNLHIVYYSELFGLYKPYYHKVIIGGGNREYMKIGKGYALTDISTFANFTRPGDYFTVRTDSNNLPHVVWTDGRDNEMDIYYAHQIVYDYTETETTTTSTTSNPSSTISTTTSTTVAVDLIPILVGGVAGLSLTLVIALLLLRKKDFS